MGANEQYTKRVGDYWSRGNQNVYDFQIVISKSSEARKRFEYRLISKLQAHLEKNP